jgi:hypothetical protein
VGIRVLIADYKKERRQHLSELLKLRFPDYDVDELETELPLPPRDTNLAILQKVTARPYDLFIGHIGGNPSGNQCLTVFKARNRTGKAVLYTKASEIKLSDFDGLKLADKVFQRSAIENRLFDDANEMFDIIRDVMERPAINATRLPLKEPPVIAALIGGILLLIGTIITAVVTYLKPR